MNDSNKTSNAACEHCGRAPAPIACEGNCSACGRYARLRADGSQACADGERCAASRARDARTAALLEENAALRQRAAECEYALRAALARVVELESPRDTPDTPAP